MAVRPPLSHMQPRVIKEKKQAAVPNPGMVMPNSGMSSASPELVVY